VGVRERERARERERERERALIRNLLAWVRWQSQGEKQIVTMTQIH
jgi:hypothetical protein